MDRGFELVNRGEYGKALDVGMQLKSMRNTSAFEILALAHAGLDDLEQAIEVLEEGVTKGPTVWRLWQLLGNYRSDIDRYDESHAAYQRALACPDVDAPSVHLNIAIALTRQERIEDARRELSLVDSPELQTHAAAQQVRLLILEKAYEAAIRYAQAVRSELESDPNEVNDVEAGARATLEVELAEAIWLGRQNMDAVREHVHAALANSPSHPAALQLLRKAESARSPSAQRFQLILVGEWSNEAETGFFVSFVIVAENERHALEYARPIVEIYIGTPLEVDECTNLEASPDELMGVYEYSDFHLYPLNDAED